MSIQTLKAELSEELVLFLQQQGFSHIMSLGDDRSENGPDGGIDDYNLLALKADDPWLKVEESHSLINPIDSDDVKTMAEGVDSIRFLIEIPQPLYQQYLNINGLDLNV
jgi:hypothetical protein